MSDNLRGRSHPINRMESDAKLTEGCTPTSSPFHS